MKHGIDISKYQPTPDWPKVASSQDFCILRVGYRGWGTGQLVLDSKYNQFYAELMKTNLGKGVYFFSQATNYDEGVEEALFCLKHCDVKAMNYGIWFDTESATSTGEGRADKISVLARTQAAQGFITTIEKAGGIAGIYASSSWYSSRLDMNELKNAKLWVADYRGYCGYQTSNTYLWQYSSDGPVDGVEGRVDMNYQLKDFEGVEPSKTYEAGTYKIGPASFGDIKTLTNLANELQINVQPLGDYIIVGPMSKGDSQTICEKAEELLLPVEPYEKPQSAPTTKYENFIWKMDALRITQRYGIVVDGVQKDTYSHDMTNALDMGGLSSATNDWIYAPFSCKVVKIYPTYNTVFFQSIDKVNCLDGVERFLTLQLTHINDSDLNTLGLKVGKSFVQGEKFYREGKKGATSGHVHVAVGEGKFSGTGWTKTSTGTNCINNPLFLHKVAWLDGNTYIMGDGGYKWTKLAGVDGPQEEEKQDVVGTLTVKSGTWNVRKGPSTTYPIVKVVRGGEVWVYTGTTSGWYKLSDGYLAPSAVAKINNVIKVKAGTWNIRKGPSTSYPTNGVVKGPIELSYWGIEDGWYRIGDRKYIGPAAVEED